MWVCILTGGPTGPKWMWVLSLLIPFRFGLEKDLIASDSNLIGRWIPFPKRYKKDQEGLPAFSLFDTNSTHAFPGRAGHAAGPRSSKRRCSPSTSSATRPISARPGVDRSGRSGSPKWQRLGRWDGMGRPCRPRGRLVWMIDLEFVDLAKDGVLSSWPFSHFYAEAVCAFFPL